MRFDFRSCIRPVVHVKAPAFPVKRQTGVSNYPTACHLPAIASSGESVHPESFDVEAKLGCGPEIGYV